MHPCCKCFRSFVDANMLQNRRQRASFQLGGFSQQGAVGNIHGKDTRCSSWWKMSSLKYCLIHKKLKLIKYFVINNNTHSCVFNLSEAFHRARRKMQAARETLPKHLINSTSQLQIEFSAETWKQWQPFYENTRRAKCFRRLEYKQHYSWWCTLTLLLIGLFLEG